MEYVYVQSSRAFLACRGLTVKPHLFKVCGVWHCYEAGEPAHTPHGEAVKQCRNIAAKFYCFYKNLGY